MNLTKEDLELIKQVVHDAVATEVRGLCACRLSQEAREEAQHLFIRIQEAGGGNIGIGVDEFAKSVALITRIRRHGERIGGAVSIAFFVAAASGVLGAIGIAIRTWLATNGKQN